MAHNLMENRRMFYTGETPWHKLGVHLDNPATAKEAIEAAQLDYKLELQPLFLQNGTKVVSKQAVVRCDNGSEVGVVGQRYQIVQNVEAFNFFDVLVGEGQAIYHTAGALGNGERIWIMAKLPSNIVINKDDVIEKYLLLTNSHDGTSSLRCFFTPVRVVCQNTLNMSLRDAKGIALRHTGNIMTKIDAAREILGITVDYYVQFEKMAKQMAEFKMDADLTDAYFDAVLGVNDPQEMKTRMQNKKQDLIALMHNGRGNDGKTLWSAYNAVTEYVDHKGPNQAQVKDPTMKLKDIWFGTGASFKEEAWKEALQLIA